MGNIKFYNETRKNLQESSLNNNLVSRNISTRWSRRCNFSEIVSMLFWYL